MSKLLPLTPLGPLQFFHKHNESVNCRCFCQLTRFICHQQTLSMFMCRNRLKSYGIPLTVLNESDHYDCHRGLLWEIRWSASSVIVDHTSRSFSMNAFLPTWIGNAHKCFPVWMNSDINYTHFSFCTRIQTMYEQFEIETNVNSYLIKNYKLEIEKIC